MPSVNQAGTFDVSGGPTPVVPEAPWAALLPILGLAVLGGVALRRRTA